MKIITNEYLASSLTVIILTNNEENNINAVLDSLENVSDNIFVVDSFSDDSTIEILEKNDIAHVQHAFHGYSEQRNWAQENNPFNTEWVLHLDADEPISKELGEWLVFKFENESKNVDGFMFSRRTMFMGKWIKHGGQYPNFHLRLYKTKFGLCETKA